MRAINSLVLPETNPCINKAIHVLLIYIRLYGILRISNPGLSHNLSSTLVTCTVANVIEIKYEFLLHLPLLSLKVEGFNPSRGAQHVNALNFMFDPYKGNDQEQI